MLLVFNYWGMIFGLIEEREIELYRDNFNILFKF